MVARLSPFQTLPAKGESLGMGLTTIDTLGESRNEAIR